MEDIEALRNKMDRVTLELVRLLKQRTDVARQIGEVKKTSGRGVTDEAREGSLRRKVIDLAAEIGLEEGTAARFLNFLINESVRTQSAYKQSAGGQTHLSVFLRAKEMEQEGRKVIHMEVGEPDFMPPEPVRTAMQDAFDKGLVRYGQAKGTAGFRRAIAEKESADHGVRLDQENVLVTPGARFSVFLAITGLLNPADEMIVIEPAWPAYRDCALNAGVKVRTVRTTLEGGWEPDAGSMEELVNANTRMLVLNYPNNPTGKVLPGRLQDDIVEMARRKNLYVLSDEIYGEYARVPWKSVLEYGYERAVVTRSFSKSHAMTGFRIGYTVSDRRIVDSMARLQALCLTSVAEPIQHAAMAALGQDVSANAARVSSRLDLLAREARKAGLEFAGPDGAMYLFARAGTGGFDGADLACRALEEGLAVAPGEGFGDYKEFIRICACRDEKTLKEGMGILSGIMGRR